MHSALHRQLAGTCLLSILLALALFLLSPGITASASASQETGTSYTLHMKKATDLTADSICDSLFYEKALTTPGENGLVNVTMWVADPIPNYPTAGQSLTSVQLIYGGTTYPAILDTENKVLKSFGIDPMFFPAAGEYSATPITFSIPQEAIDSSATGSLKCSVYVNAVLTSQQEFFMVMSDPKQIEEQNSGEKAENEDGEASKEATEPSSKEPSKSSGSSKTKAKASTSTKKSTKTTSSASKKASSSKAVTYTYRYSYSASFRKATDLSTESICNPLFCSSASVVVSSGLAKVTLWVIDPIPNYSSEGTPLSNVSFTYGGKTYKASYNSSSKVSKHFGQSDMFISKAGSYPATPITVTLPASAVKASKNGGLVCNAFIRAVLKTDQSFYVVLSNGKLLGKTASSTGSTSNGSKASGGGTLTASETISAKAATHTAKASKNGKASGGKKSTASRKSPAPEAAGELPSKTGTAHGSYTHPVTQKVADSAGPVGQSIGQAMVDKVVDPTCLLQTGTASWLTLRFNMAKSISKIRFQMQEPGETSWADAAYSVSGTGDNTEDLRVQVTSQDTILKCTFHVGPIDRDVTFFIYEDGWADGNSTTFAAMTYDDEAAALGSDTTAPTTIGDENASSQPNVMLWLKIGGAVILLALIVAGVLVFRHKKRKKGQQPEE